jgi:uncharacterized protein (TIGR02145 family)
MNLIKPLALLFAFTIICCSLTSAQEVITDYDGNKYATRQIGEQVWMMENLNSIHDANGNKIKRVCYELIRENCDKYGGLYAWDELRVDESNDSLQGICPDGWHIPEDTEWTILIDNLGGADSAAYMIKMDTTLFNIQYAGNYHYRLKNYNYQGSIAYFWTASSFSTTAAWMRMIGRKNVNVNRSTVPKTYCLSVRCIKD